MVRDLHSMLLGIHVMLKSNLAMPHQVSECGAVAAVMAITAIMVTMAITVIAAGAVTMKIMGITAMT
ncbi:hypothetical protein MF6394_27175 [Pseudomonas sp. MF6394]|nr:hypothetical protein A7K61_04435 [Pseudomonas sp. AP42]OOV92724.1 hypothetical protein MF6394_27175 [Pseudomonas sp. MF6394]